MIQPINEPFLLFQAKKINLLIHDLIDEDQEEHVEYEVTNMFQIITIHSNLRMIFTQ